MFKKKENQPLSLKEAHYKYVLEEDFAHYAEFKSKLVYKTRTIRDHEVRYIERGAGPLLLMLPGSTGKALSFYEYIEAFSDNFRTVAIDYPIVASLSEMKTLITAFILEIKVPETPVYVMANSFGTVILQEILIESPELFDQIFFIHGISKDDLVSKKTVKLHQRSIKSFLKSVSFLNYESFQRRFGKRIRKSVNIYPDHISMRLFWEGFYEEMIYDTTQNEMISNYRFMKDFWTNRTYDKAQFEKVIKPVFIIESLTDMDAERSEKLALCSLFKGHELFVLKGDANLSLIKNKDEIVDLVHHKIIK
ncbi:alpha/beta fold hydrolase [Fusibacter sp. 3D3]|uniref:alpha/beta fold hydrolase n=1 Tax=Fusibacter sp. 3D3 TaxID=1048380 RepID=UPI000853D268|nr:alpha/beta hydrolase [Fusibacter sp. 3D3]GAU77955.1 hypothetical protein F3D3_2584 [Fusibacter sp. 3D3]